MAAKVFLEGQPNSLPNKGKMCIYVYVGGGVHSVSFLLPQELECIF